MILAPVVFFALCEMSWFPPAGKVFADGHHPPSSDFGVTGQISARQAQRLLRFQISAQKTNPRLFCFFLKHPDSARFDNPQFSIQFFPLQSGGQGANRFQQIFARGFARQSQNGDAGIIAGPKMQRIGKIQVERNQGAPFAPATFDEFRVFGFLEGLAGDRCHVVFGAGKNFTAAFAGTFRRA
jgi:hypothetical protein